MKGLSVPVRRLQPITRELVDEFRGLPDEASASLWGLGSASKKGTGRGSEKRPEGRGDAALPSWAAASLQAWGMIGVAAHDPDCVRFLLVCPGDALPDGHPMRKVPRTRGAAVLVGVHAPSRRRPGLSAAAGRTLCQFLAGRLVGSVPAIEAGGVPAGRTVGGPDPRVAEAAWLESLGFRLVDPLDAAPVRRMQLDLRRTVTEEDLPHRVMAWLQGLGGDPAAEPRRGFSSRTTCDE
ncbi:hypothetical protein PACID_34180 [Acidipropionibacterium acidipropionici ATCC 4875]|uniref:Uncharacterized protein n=1 Tax=Acidipropionibacterium acidipropionici (strain ATCC 4875 / DSM 20272 / JCM 6432 / NBRC 12425 / NCIMB 8070 / 4) TaxID=1171373 RepID=K7RSW0_ACIA4|nr:hypothetical protein [Acidipropionibacterium acidipropionici]AFV91174.1 hypothetical protein PACID_34180 [Acidipropionibacterium acidipropionici ATCC 4875]